MCKQDKEFLSSMQSKVSVMSTITKKKLLALTAALFFSVSGAEVASATTITYSDYTWIGDVVTITAPRNVTGGAGQITFTGVVANPPGRLFIHDCRLVPGRSARLNESRQLHHRRAFIGSPPSGSDWSNRRPHAAG